MKKILFWLVWNIPLGKLTPYILGIALGRKPINKGQKKGQENDSNCKTEW